MSLFIIFILCWLLVIIQRSLRWIWLWQLKEYRLDRFFAEFSGLKLLRLLFPVWQRVKAVLFVGTVLGGAVFLGERFLLLSALFVYVVEAGQVLWKSRSGGLVRPAFTLKATLLTVWAVGVSVLPFLTLKELQGVATGTVFAVSLPVLSDLFLPFVVFAGILLLKAPTIIARYVLMRRAARHLKALPNLLVIGIAGSFGKSSTKEFLATLLSKRFRVAKAPEHVNSEIALAKFVSTGLNETHEVFVAELGAYRKGEIRRMAAMIQPSIAILTGINEQHVALFGSLENIKSAKYELIEALPERGLAIFNGGTPGSREFSERSDRPKKLYAVNEPADCYAEDVRMERQNENDFGAGAPSETTRKHEELSWGRRNEVTEEGGRWGDELVFQVKSGVESRTFKVPLFGFQHVPNILAATLAALSLGMTLEEIRERAQYLEAPAQTMRIVRNRAGRVIIDDTYSANPDGVYAALDALQLLEAPKKVLVMPSLIELGQESDRIHEEVGGKAARICDLIILTTLEGFAALERGIGSMEKLVWAANPSRVLALLEQETSAGDAILLESRVPELVRRSLLESHT